MRKRIAWGTGALALVALVFASGAVAAAPGGGTIFYTYQSLTWTMNSDGTGKASLPGGVNGSPSRALHGGHRWFLQVQDIAGESYPNSTTRREVFAVRDDGNASFTKQLTNQPDLETAGPIGWKPGDGHVYVAARRWSGGTVVENGVYVAEILFDGNGDVTGLAAQPTTPAIAIAHAVSDVRGMDWAPDGTRIAYVVKNPASQELRTADSSGGGQSLFVAGGTTVSGPSWSPDGTKIAFTVALTGLLTIKPDGTGQKTLIKKGKDYYFVGPSWSPTGSHMVYTLFRTTGIPREYDVYRANADGSQQTNLTGDIAGQPVSVSWR